MYMRKNNGYAWDFFISQISLRGTVSDVRFEFKFIPLHMIYSTIYRNYEYQSSWKTVLNLFVGVVWAKNE